VDPAHVDPSGGTVLDPLIEALGYVTFVRNATAVVVQSCLADLEARAARRVQAALTQVADAVEGFRKRLGLKATTVPLSRGKTGSVDLTIVYRATDVGFRATLFRALSEAVRQREKLDRLTASLTAARKRVREEKVSEALARSPYTKAAPRPSPRRQEAERAAATVENLATEAAATLRQMQGVIALSEPVALLALPSMTRWSDPQHMTQLLGETLADVDAQLGRFRVASAELARGLLPVHPAHEVPYDVVERLSVPAAGPEATVAARALERFDAEPGVLPLLHLQVWSELAGTQEVQPVGLSFSVHHWYVLELATALDAVEEGRRVTAAVMRLLGKATAVVSLTLIFLPPVGAVVRGALFAVDLVLAGYALYRVVSDVRGAATAVAVQAAGGASFETMSAIAELCAFRRDVMAALPAQALLELAALALGEASRTVRKLLLARAYYADVQVLLE
jgi:hypothetical protein